MQSLSDVLRVVMAILVVYRVSQLVVYDDGPMFILKKMREAVGRRAAQEQGNLGRWSSCGELIHCPHCVGVWAALFCLPLVVWPTLIGDVLLLWWGLAGGQSFLEIFSGGRDAG